MKRLSIAVAFMVLAGLAPIGPISAGIYQPVSVAMMSDVGEASQAEISVPREPSGIPRFVADIKSSEMPVWESEEDPSKPMDIAKVWLSHDAGYFHVRIATWKNLSEIEGDPFISIAMDCDLNPSTGMPKATANSYNMGGEDFFARFSTAYGEQRFVIDRWDQGKGDTVETGGLASARASGKEIRFSIPRLAIGDPPRLDFKIVSRTYQSVNPDLSADHLSYDLVGSEPVKGWGIERIAGRTYRISSPVSLTAGVSHHFLKWDNVVVPISRHILEPAGNPDSIVWTNRPQTGKHLFMTRIEAQEDDENLKFTIRFSDSLKGMGDCDLKVWAMLDTDGKPNVGFEGVKLADNYDDFILEVASELRSVRSKLYTASKGMGYNQPSLNLGTLDYEKGVCEMVVKKSRIGNPSKIRARFACGGYKSEDADWDSTPRMELPGKIMFLQFQVPYRENPRGFPVEVTKLECVMDTANIYFRLAVRNLEKGSVTIWIDQDMNLATGLPKSPNNPPGIDNTIEVTSALGSVWQVMPDLSRKKVDDFLGIRYNDGRLSFPVPLKLLSNPKAIRFHVTAQAGAGTQAHSVWMLILGQEGLMPCEPKIKPETVSIGGSARIRWTSAEKNPLGFYVYRRGDGDSFDRITNTPVFENEFVDTGVAIGKYYQYRITAICSDGSVSEMSEISGILVKTDKPQAKISIDKTFIDFGQRFKTMNLCEGFTIKNLGPGAVEFRIASSDLKLSATSESLRIEEGQSKRVNVCITDNLPVGAWERTVSIDTGEIKVIIPVKVEVVKSSEGDKSIDPIRIERQVEKLVVTWTKPPYNASALTGYELEITELYFDSPKSTRIISVSSDKTSYTLEGLNFTTIYRIMARALFENGPGIASIAEGMPLPPNIYIIMKIGSTEAIVNGKATRMASKAIIDSKSGKTLVPFRFIAESLRCRVEYDQKTRTIKMTQGYRTVRLTVGSPTATIDGMKIDCNPPPSIIGGSTYVPVRFVADAFMAETTWDSAKKQVSLFFPTGYRP